MRRDVLILDLEKSSFRGYRYAQPFDSARVGHRRSKVATVKLL